MCGNPPPHSKFDRSRARVYMGLMTVRSQGMVPADDVTGYPAWRKRFATPWALERRVAAYVAQCNENDEPLTVSGMALYCGITTDCLRKYGQRDGYGEVVKWAKLQLEASIEARLYGRDTVQGAKFALENNFNWNSSKNGRPDDDGSPKSESHLIDLSTLSQKQLEALSEIPTIIDVPCTDIQDAELIEDKRDDEK